MGGPRGAGVRPSRAVEKAAAAVGAMVGAAEAEAAEAGVRTGGGRASAKCGTR